MRDRAPIAFIPFVLALVMAHALPIDAEEPTPTPTARPKARKKLGGGSFGTPPGPTPTASATSAGSLANVVRQTQEETQATGTRRSRGLVITNESLRNPASTPPSASVTIIGKAGSKPVVKGPAPAPTPDGLPEYRDASGRTEADWKLLAAAARDVAERTGAEFEAAQAEVRRLENDFYAWSDGNYRERVIRPAWDQAKERAKLLEVEAGKARAAIDDLEDEARKSGTPPGWLR